MAQAGGAQALAGEQAVGDQRARQAVQVLEQQAGFSNARFLLVASTPTSTCGGRMDARRFMDGCDSVESPCYASRPAGCETAPRLPGAGPCGLPNVIELSKRKPPEERRL
jgi:hypothetical protein